MEDLSACPFSREKCQWIGASLVNTSINHKSFFTAAFFYCFLSGDVKELSILGGHLGPRCWPTAIDMVAKHHLPMEDLITHKFSLSQFLPALQMVVSGSESIKVMLYPSNKAWRRWRGQKPKHKIRIKDLCTSSENAFLHWFLDKQSRSCNHSLII